MIIVDLDKAKRKKKGKKERKISSKKKHLLAFQTLGRIHFYLHITKVDFFTFFLNVVFDSDLISCVMAFHSLTPNRENDLY